MNRAFIALGTNIEPRETFLADGLSALAKQKNLKIVKKSSIYETAPVGYLDQDNFLNMVIEVKTSLSVIELLNYCQDIEQQLGRERSVRFGPRTIDLDILMYNQENSNTERLIIPHPRMHERAFVLIPLNEIAANLYIECLGEHVTSMVDDLSEKDKRDVRKWIVNEKLQD